MSSLLSLAHVIILACVCCCNLVLEDQAASFTEVDVGAKMTDEGFAREHLPSFVLIALPPNGIQRTWIRFWMGTFQVLLSFGFDPFFDPFFDPLFDPFVALWLVFARTKSSTYEKSSLFSTADLPSDSEVPLSGLGRGVGFLCCCESLLGKRNVRLAFSANFLLSFIHFGYSCSQSTDSKS